MSELSEVARILLACERDGLTAAYLSEDPGNSTDITKSIGVLLPYDSEGGNVFAVSDLHLAAGRGDDGRYDGCENFFADDAWRRFLADAHATSTPGRRHTLILNGDTIDFLRVTYVPGRPHAPKGLQRLLTQIKVRRLSHNLRNLSGDLMLDFEEWRQILLEIGIDMSVDELIASIKDKEELYGLKTNDFKSVLRLDIVMRGHQGFFEGLAEWLQRGNRLLVTKGNHDLEWFWLAIRNKLRLELAKRLAPMIGADVKTALMEVVFRNVMFADHAVLVDGDVYLEHGHPYDPVTRVIGKNTVLDGTELNIPFGSFFNRYVLDVLEVKYPYLDKIRPTPNVLPMLLRQDGFAGLRMVLTHLIFMLKMVGNGYLNYILGKNFLARVLLLVLAVVVPPIALITYQVCARPGIVLGILEWVATLAVVQLLVQALAQFQLSEPDSLSRFARIRFDENPAYRLMTFGHTHNPSQFREEGERWFYNTGTWIPVIETSAAELREDRTFTFLRLDHDGARLQPGILWQWDDAAGRPEPMILIRGAN